MRPGMQLDADRVLSYVEPILAPAHDETFRFTRTWLRAQAVRIGSPRSPAYSTGLQFNLPPEYLLIHRVTTGAIGVLCQLEAEASWRAELERWLPGFAVARRRPSASRRTTAPRAARDEDTA